MKKLINHPDTVVTDALAGMAAAHPSLSVDFENRVITRAGGPVECSSRCGRRPADGPRRTTSAFGAGCGEITRRPSVSESEKSRKP